MCSAIRRNCERPIYIPFEWVKTKSQMWKSYMLWVQRNAQAYRRTRSCRHTHAHEMSITFHVCTNIHTARTAHSLFAPFHFENYKHKNFVMGAMITRWLCQPLYRHIISLVPGSHSQRALCVCTVQPFWKYLFSQNGIYIYSVQRPYERDEETWVCVCVANDAFVIFIVVFIYSLYPHAHPRPRARASPALPTHETIHQMRWLVWLERKKMNGERNRSAKCKTFVGVPAIPKLPHISAAIADAMHVFCV